MVGLNENVKKLTENGIPEEFLSPIVVGATKK